MEADRVKKLWNRNADAWTKLSRLGYDVYRDLVNTPAFFYMLPQIEGKSGLDIACGEGSNTRKLAERGAVMTGLDIAEQFITHANEWEAREPTNTRFVCGSALELPFSNGSFDFATSFMALMDMPDQACALEEAHRVLRPGGFFQFSISHPCFFSWKTDWNTDDKDHRTARTCADYFKPAQGEMERWIFGRAPAEVRQGLDEFSIPRFERTLSGWLNLVVETGFALEAFDEPFANDRALATEPSLFDTRIVAYFLIVRCRKP